MNARARNVKQTAPVSCLMPKGLLQRKCDCGGSYGRTGECDECGKKATLQRRAANHTEPTSVPPLVHEVLRSPGQPLDAVTRALMEPRFGHDFSRVRVHTDAKAAESARAVNALAYTVGRDVVFGSSQYQPQTQNGRSLLGHELAHIVQQGSAPFTYHRLELSAPDGALEREANTAENRLSQSIQSSPVKFRHHAVSPRAGQLVLRKSILTGLPYDIPDWLRTRRFNRGGPFTNDLLHEISVRHKSTQEVAQKIVDALESSADFLRTADELDKFHGKKGDPKITVTIGGTGSKFIPRGAAFQFGEGRPVQVDPVANTISIDYSKSPLFSGTAPEQVTAFVDTVIYESAHALHSAKRMTHAGLIGELKEEQRTRKTEIKQLEQVKAGAKDVQLSDELALQIGKVKQPNLKLRTIAEDLVEAGNATYVEAFFVSQAISNFRDKREKLAEKLGRQSSFLLDALASIEKPPELSDFDSYLFNVQHVISETQSIRKERKIFLLKALNALKLKELTEIKAPRLTDEENFVLQHVLLLKTYHVKALISNAWKQHPDVKGPEKEEIRENNAREFLGRPGIYRTIHD